MNKIPYIIRKTAKPSLVLGVLLLCCAVFPTQAQFISQQNGAWADGATWGNNSPGVVGVDYPGQNDDVIIQGSHQVVINALVDNGGPAVAPEGLGVFNIGDGSLNGAPSFPSGETQMFYQQGDISILKNGILRANCHLMLAGRTVIQGTLSSVADVVNLGNLNATSHATLDIGNSYIVTGNSFTDIDGTISAANDLYIDNYEAVIGGSGSLSVTNNLYTSTPSNNDPSAQICSNFSINCGNDCNPSISGGQTVIIGASEHPMCLEFFPVEFKSIRAKLINFHSAEIHWVTASELNNDWFEIERSVNAQDWEMIGRVKAIGTSAQTNYYVYKDDFLLKGNLYYRLKQIDYDGTFTYSKSIVLHVEDFTEGPLLAPNIVTQNEHLRVLNAQDIEQLEILDQHGKCVKRAINPSSTILVDIGTGLFNVRIKMATGWVYRRLIVI